jgi:hypothetical protein
VLVALLVTLLLPTPQGSAQESWRAVEEVRIGNQDEATTFSSIRGVVVDARGRIWVLDYATQNLRIFGPDGSLLKTVGRKGSGPGEFQAANGLVIGPDGRVVVNDPPSARFTVLGPDGDYLESRPVSVHGCGFLWNAFVDAESRLYDPLFLPSDTERRGGFRRFSADWRQVDTLMLPRCPGRKPFPEPYAVSTKNRRMYLSVPFIPMPISRTDRDGHHWCGTSDRYELIRLRIPTGEPAGKIRGTSKPLPVTRRERDSVIGVLKERTNEAPLDYSRIPSTKPIVTLLDGDDQGRLWVRLTSPDRHARWEVWTADERMVARVTADFTPPGYWPVLIQGDLMYSVVVDEDEVPYVVRARLLRQ